MPRYLLISGSPRKGNTDCILERIFDKVEGKKELIYLRELDIKHCNGCLYCNDHHECSIKDDMQEIYEKMRSADLYIIGSPNYFNNVPGLLKDYIDRTNIFYGTDSIKGKKLISIVVGAGAVDDSQKVLEQALHHFANFHELDVIGSFCFRARDAGEIERNPDLLDVVKRIETISKS